MTNNQPPDFVRFVYVINIDRDIYSVNINIEKPEMIGDETVTNWEIEAFCNHITGMMYAPESNIQLTRKIEKEIIKRNKFDAEYYYYKTLAQYEF
jgi:hypothetical protein